MICADVCVYIFNTTGDAIGGGSKVHLSLACNKVTSEVVLLNWKPARDKVQRVFLDATNKLIYSFHLRSPFFDFDSTAWEIIVPDIGCRNYKYKGSERIMLDATVLRIKEVYKHCF